MPDSYRGLTIPAYADAADAPKAFADFVDSGPVPRFANAGARDAAIPSPTDGMLVYLIDQGQFLARIGGVWLNPFLGEGGGSISGQINMQGNRIINLGNPAAANDAISRGWGQANFAAISHNHSGAQITSGTIPAARIANLPASVITSGQLNAARLPNHSAALLTSGTVNIARLPVGTGSNNVAAGNHVHSNLTSTTFSGYVSVPQGTPVALRFVGSIAAGSTGFQVVSDGPGGIGAVFDGLPVASLSPTAARFYGALRVDTALTTGGGTEARLVDVGGGSYELRRLTSSRRYKTEIEPMPTRFAASVIELLSPRRYRDSDGEQRVGLIAEEVIELAPEVVDLDAEGRPDAVAYAGLVPHLIGALQELSARVRQLETA